MAHMQPPDLDSLIALIKAKSRNVVWTFSVETQNWNYQLLCVAETDIGGKDMRVSRYISDQEIENNKIGWTRLAEFIVEDVTRVFARALFQAEATV
jgi:hypothetical protein